EGVGGQVDLQAALVLAHGLERCRGDGFGLLGGVVRRGRGAGEHLRRIAGDVASAQVQHQGAGRVGIEGGQRDQCRLPRRRGGGGDHRQGAAVDLGRLDRKSTRLNSSHVSISYAVFCLKKKKKPTVG